LTQARFGRWDDVLKVPQPAVTNDFLVDRIVWHFVRGLALCARGDGEAAAREHAALRELVATDGAKKLDNPQFPATSIFGVAEHALAGKVAAARGETKAALEHLENAVAAEDKLPYMEPPYWPYPSRQLLGAACLRAGDLAKAEKAFREDLAILPRNGWALFGLEATLRQQGKTEAAASVGREFHQAWKLADGMPDLAWY
jgi:tetratricopeptide (TPR) repeat protein